MVYRFACRCGKAASRSTYAVFRSAGTIANSPASCGDKEYNTVIVGAGHNGLIAATYLARGGRKVLILERRHIAGGAAITEEIVPGFKFSRASYLLSLLRPQILKDLDLKGHGLRLHKRDPSSFTPLWTKSTDQSSRPAGLLLGSDAEQNRNQISQFSSKDAEMYGRYEEFIARIANSVDPLLDSVPLNMVQKSSSISSKMGSLRALLKAGSRLGLKHLPGAYELMTSPAAKVLDKWFEGDVLKAALGTDAIIGAMLSPYSPGSGYVLLHHVMGGVDGGGPGEWAYPHGGMGAVTGAMAQAAVKAGVDICLNSPVREFLVKQHAGTDDPRVHGVQLEDGQAVLASSVLSNATADVTFNKLTPKGVLPDDFLADVNGVDYTSPVTKISVALSSIPDFLSAPNTAPGVPGPHHRATIHINCESMRQVHSAYSDAAFRGVPSETPLIEMCIPSTLDDSLTPEGCHVMSLFTQFTPYTRSDGVEWTQEAREEYAERVFQCIEEYAPGFRSLVVGYECLPPPELERVFGLTGGNIFHGSMSLDQLYWTRPSRLYPDYRSPIRGLYLCGSSAHPGGGVMGAPGYNAAKVVLSSQL
ncbi:pyridine nucleotide-disulfide oxidoreductase domain-containing protein 2-like [Sycon ciliatum]|uniref:pyridine nucleotide-disulfide oxidoreductase domain-containing protein 2-like n=1 Tax=Sycon ciliatum TaxID=27933 RepID=UPI0031F6B7D0